jgi:hypothetical protein
MSEESTESEMKIEGYFKGKMCPFVMASVGGTTTVAGGSTLESYRWKHLVCMGEFCRLWDKEEKECSFKVMTESLKK